MPVLFNTQSGQHEDLDPKAAQAALAAGTHEVPVVGPDQSWGSVPAAKFADAQREGFQQPDPQALQGMLDKAKYETPLEQAKTVAEGALNGATFGIGNDLEAAATGNADAQLKRRTVNSGDHMIGQGVGLVASSMAGFGEGAALEALGTAVAPIAETALGRVGSAATKAAIENMVFQAGDDASKAYMGDPEMNATHFIQDVGMAGVLGAAFGGAGRGTAELWALGPGKQLGKFMDALQNRSKGLPVELAEKAQIEMGPNFEAALSNSSTFQELMASPSKTGAAVQSEFKDLQQAVRESVGETLGHSPEQIGELHNLSKADVGEQLGKGIHDTLQQRAEPIAKAYSETSAMYKEMPVTPELQASIGNELSAYATENQLSSLANDAKFNLVQKVLAKMPEQQTAESLRLFSSDLRSTHTFMGKPETWKVAKDIANIIDEARESMIEHALGKTQGPEAVAHFVALKDSYKGLMRTIDALDERLHVGGYQGPESFLKALKEMGPEKIAQKLNVGKDTQLQQLLEKQFPEVAALVKQNERAILVKSAVDRHGELDSNKLLKKLFGPDSVQPEYRDYILSPEAQQRLKTIYDFSKSLPDNANPSGSASMFAKLWKHMPGTATGIATLLTGHNPAAAFLVGQATNLIGREAPDAIRLGMLKFLSSDMGTNPAALKSAVEMASAVLRGESALNKATKAVFGAGTKIIAEPKPSELKKLSEHVDTASLQPGKLLDVGGHAGHYMPETGQALGSASARVVQYLAALRPHEEPLGPLDNKRQPSKAETHAYDRALRIAQNPMVIMNDLKDGNVSPADIRHLNAMYPAMHEKIGQKLMNEVINVKSAKTAIPYKTKLALGAFMGQPFEASMKQQNIMANQMSFGSNGPMQAPQPQMHQAKPPRSNPHMIDVANSYATPNQRRASSRHGRP